MVIKLDHVDLTISVALVAILAVGMTGLIVDSTSTATRCVAASIRSPSSLLCDPADFSLAHQTTDPVAAIFFLDDDVTPRAFHGFSVCHHVLQHLLCLLSCFVVLCSDAQVILIVLTIHVFVDGSAEKAVSLIAEVAAELIDFVLIDAPPSTVGGLTVEAVLRAALCDVQTQLQEPLVLLLCEQLFYLPIQ